MTTLKELAAQYDLYMAEDIPAKYFNKDSRYQAGFKSDTSAIPETLTKSDLVEVGVFYECETQDKGTDREYHYIENTYILLKGKDSNVLLMLMGNDYRNKGKYYFHLYYGIQNRLTYAIDNYQIRDAFKGLQEPNRIGVFTERKISDWLAHGEAYAAALNNLHAEWQAKNKEIEVRIQTIKDCLPHAKINDHGDHLWLTTDMFEVELTHQRRNAYLDIKTRFKGGWADVARIEDALKG